MMEHITSRHVAEHAISRHVAEHIISRDVAQAEAVRAWLLKFDEQALA